jgi:hypothetical protein
VSEAPTPADQTDERGAPRNDDSALAYLTREAPVLMRPFVTTAASVVLDSIPFVNEMKSAYEFTTGRSLIDGSELSRWASGSAMVLNVVDLGIVTDALRIGKGAEKAAAEKTVATVAEDAVRFHHPYPKYLGGEVQQILEPLPKSVHDAFHSGLDKILPR